MPHKIIAELEEREIKKDLCLLLAKRSSLSTICLTIFLGIHETKDKTKKITHCIPYFVVISTDIR
jgi:hypothetical protein